MPAATEGEAREGVARYAGFSLHAGTGVEGERRAKLERLARYMTRSAVAVDRRTLTPQGYVRYRLKTPYRDGTTHVVFEPLDFLARLKRVFAIEIERCRRCGGRIEVIASIEDPALIERILAHVKQRAEDDPLRLPVGARAAAAVVALANSRRVPTPPRCTHTAR